MKKFQQLTTKEKIEHIWIYYRYHILGTIVGIFLIYSVSVEVFGPKPPEPTANVVIIGKYRNNEEQIDKFKKSVEDIIENDEGRKVDVSMYLVDWEQPAPITAAMDQKLMLMFQAREIDVLIIEEHKFDMYVQNIEDNVFEPLDKEEELSEILEANKDNLVKRKFKSDINEQVYGLFIKDNIKLHEVGLGDDYIVSIPVVALNKDNAVEVVKWLYE